MDERLRSIRIILKEQDLDAALISDTANIFYLTGYSGFSAHERDAFLFITKKQAYLLTNALYITAVEKQVKHFTVCEIAGEMSYRSWLEKLGTKHRVHKIGIEDTNLTVAEYKKISPLFAKKKTLLIEDLRIIKTFEEIKKIYHACLIGDDAFSHVLKRIKKDMTEKEVAQELEAYIRQQNADISFPTIIAFSANAATPHHTINNTRLKANDSILFDFGVKYENYSSDMSRTIFFGNPNDEQKHIYETVREAQQKAVTYANRILNEKNESLIASNVDAIARDYIRSKGFPPFLHSLGHGIGIEVHESPSLSPRWDDELTEGMVFSIEPGIYLPGNCGVRIEDLYVIEKNKLKQLTLSSKDIISV